MTPSAPARIFSFEECLSIIAALPHEIVELEAEYGSYQAAERHDVLCAWDGAPSKHTSRTSRALLVACAAN